MVPDIAVPETKAYDLAYTKALQHVLALADVPPPITDEARDALAGLPASATALPARHRVNRAAGDETGQVRQLGLYMTTIMHFIALTNRQ